MGPDIRRYAILEHRRDGGVHWDLLVEAEPGGQALRTWAIDAEPVAGLDLPARALADHRRVYLTYEGEVTGGRGTVRRWDEGECSVVGWEADRVALIARGRQVDGSVVLRASSGTGGASPGAPAGVASASAAGGGSGPSWVVRFGKLSRRT